MKKNNKKGESDNRNPVLQTKGVLYVSKDDTENGILFSESPLRKSVKINIHPTYFTELDKPEFNALIVELITTEPGGKRGIYEKELKKMSAFAYEKLINSCALTSRNLDFRKRATPDVKGKKPKYKIERVFG
jgi:hypothetical protein